MPRGGQRRGAEAKHARLLEMQAPPLEQLAFGARAVHRLQQRERLPIGAKDDVLAVVDDDAVAQFDPPRAPAERGRGFEHGDLPARLGERDCSGEPGPARTDHCDAAAHAAPAS